MKRFECLISANLIAFLLVSPANAELHFDQLSACDSLSKLRAMLTSQNSNCRPPRSSIEQAFAEATRFDPGSRNCFLARAPSQELSDFDCVVTDHPLARNIVCTRPAKIADMDDFKNNYLVAYAENAQTYLDKASHCAVGNGDAAMAPHSVVPPGMLPYARMRFGFILPIGKSLVGDSLIIHGYSDVDPSIRGADPAIEFVATWGTK